MTQRRLNTDDTPKVLVTSHCVLNQNAVVEPLARSDGMMRDAVHWATNHGYGIYQLPCPEFRFLGPGRPPMTTDQYNTPGFHASNQELIGPIIADLARLQNSGIRLVGALHVQGSPSCDPETGNWVADLLDAADKAGISIEMIWQLPETETGRFDPRSSRTRYGAPSQHTGPPGGIRAPIPIAGSTLPLRKAHNGA